MAKKGISPLIASVLLIAFVISISAISAPFFTQTLQKSQSGVKSSQERVISGSSTHLEIHNVKYDQNSENLTFSVQNAGTDKITNYTVAVFCGSTIKQREFNDVLQAKQVKRVEYEGCNQNDVSKIRFSSRESSAQTEQTFENPVPAVGSPPSLVSYSFDTSSEWSNGAFINSQETGGNLGLNKTNTYYPEELWSFTGHTDSVEYVTVSPNSNVVYTASRDGTLRKLWADNGSEVWSESYPDTVYSVDVAPSGEFVYISVDDGADFGYDFAFRKLWSVNGSEVWRKAAPDITNGLAVGPNGNYLYTTAWGDDSVKKIDTITANTEWSFSVVSPYGVDISSDNQFVYIAGNDDYARKVWVSNGSEIWNRELEATGVNEVAVDPSGNYVYAASGDAVYKLNADSGSTAWQLTDWGAGSFRTVALDSTGLNVYAGDNNGDVRKLDSGNNNQKWNFSEHTDWVMHIDVSTLEGTIYSASGDGTVRKINETKAFATSGSYNSSVKDASASADWKNVTITSTLNGQGADITVQFSDDNFASRKSMNTFSLTGGTETFGLAESSRYVKFNVSLTGTEGTTPELDEVVIKGEN